jgi:hypothetical protein
MKILIEQLQLNSKRVKSLETTYYTFWVRFFALGSPASISVSGWRYWPERRTLSTPSIKKSDARYFNTCKPTPDVYMAILSEVERLLGMPPAEPHAAQVESLAA